MEKLYDEVSMLRNALNSNTSLSVIKKIYQIDSEKLETGYSKMINSFN
jgi:hypothetical protein